jgi:hypothetical protein
VHELSPLINRFDMFKDHFKVTRGTDSLSSMKWRRGGAYERMRIVSIYSLSLIKPNTSSFLLIIIFLILITLFHRHI